jgi:Glycosyltransferase family 25 (LPS biosynthesis protein)
LLNASHSGLYINLDRSSDRRERIEKNIASVGLSGVYRRFAAVDGSTKTARPPLTPGELGCYLSHCEALTAASTSNGVTHIIEDDVRFSTRTPAVIATAIRAGLLDQFDIVFLDFIVPFEPAIWMRCRQQARAAHVTILDITRSTFAGSSSYLVSPRSAKKIKDICNRALCQQPRPIDLMIREQANAGSLRAGALIPFTTTVELDNAHTSTIGQRDDAPDAAFDLAMNILRYSFFIEADLAGYARPFIEDVRRTIACRPDEKFRKAAEHVLRFLDERGDK